MGSRWAMLRSRFIYHEWPHRRARIDALYRPFIQPGSPAFDIGAHTGSRSAAFARLGAQVVAVEPHPHLVTYLTKRFRRDHAITVEGQAVGATTGGVTLHVDRSNLTISTASAQWAAHAPRAPDWERTRFTDAIVVRQTTLDTLITRYGVPCFTKIDVEGYEDEVVAGLSHPLPAVSVEFLPANREVASRTLDRLEHLAKQDHQHYLYNFSLAETLSLVLTRMWWKRAALEDYLREIPPDGPSGDIYARLVNGAD